MGSREEPGKQKTRRRRAQELSRSGAQEKERQKKKRLPQSVKSVREGEPASSGAAMLRDDGLRERSGAEDGSCLEAGSVAVFGSGVDRGATKGRAGGSKR